MLTEHGWIPNAAYASQSCVSLLPRVMQPLWNDSHCQLRKPIAGRQHLLLHLS